VLKFTFIFLLSILSCTQSDELLEHSEVLEVNSVNKRIKQIFYKSDDLKIEGFVVYPAGFDPNKKYPFILNSRGGNRDFGEYQLPKYSEYLFNLASDKYIVFASQNRGSKNSEGMDEFGGADLQDSVVLYNLAKKNVLCRLT
jgi:dipeptidyl aminopeptidase/acylaminoacyl peptidase